MPMLTEIRDAACAFLKEKLPEAARVEIFAGVLDFDRIAPRNVQFADEASLFVAAGEARNMGDGLIMDMEGSFWVFSLNRNAARPTIATSAALAMIQKAALALHGSTLGMEGIAPARVGDISPISGEELEKAGFQVWQLYFTTRFAMVA